MKDNVYFLSLLKKFNTVLFGFLSTVFINRTLGPALLGDYTYTLNIINILINVLNFGINAILPNYARKNEDWVFSTFYSLSFAQFGVYCVLGCFVAIALKNSIFILYAFLVAFGILSLQILNSTIIYDFRLTTIANSLAVITNALLLFLLFIIDVKNINYVFIILIIKEAVSIILCLPVVKRNFKINAIHFEEWKTILLKGTIPMLIALLTIINYKVDILELKWLGVKSKEIGLYAVGIAFAEYALIVVDVFKDVLVNKTAKHDDLENVTFSIRLSSTSLFVIMAAMVIIGKWLIVFFYGAEYEGAYGITITVLLGVYSIMYMKLLGTLYIAQGRLVYYLCVLSCGASVNIIANILLIPILSIYGAAIATIISYTLTGLVFLIKFTKEYSFSLRNLVLMRREDFVLIRQYIHGKK